MKSVNLRFIDNNNLWACRSTRESYAAFSKMQVVIREISKRKYFLMSKKIPEIVEMYLDSSLKDDTPNEQLQVDSVDHKTKNF